MNKTTMQLSMQALVYLLTAKAGWPVSPQDTDNLNAIFEFMFPADKNTDDLTLSQKSAIALEALKPINPEIDTMRPPRNPGPKSQTVDEKMVEAESLQRWGDKLLQDMKYNKLVVNSIDGATFSSIQQKLGAIPIKDQAIPLRLGSKELKELPATLNPDAGAAIEGIYFMLKSHDPKIKPEQLIWQDEKSALLRINLRPGQKKPVSDLLSVTGIDHTLPSEGSYLLVRVGRNITSDILGKLDRVALAVSQPPGRA